MPINPERFFHQIGDRQLYVGSADAAREHYELDWKPDHVLTLSFTEHPFTTHHEPIPDSAQLTVEQFGDAVTTAEAIHAGSGTLLIQCGAGSSRSAAVTAALLSVTEGKSLAEAVEEVAKHRPEVNIHPAVLSVAHEYVTSR